ncbi:MAG: ATP-binding protein, partial [Microbacteriaceae bacterium]|nr:ATP-binding protein [Microbacteriaceae bacterium]
MTNVFKDLPPLQRRSVLSPVTSTQQLPSVDDVRTALKDVYDPEIKKPITDLGMVKDVTVAE